MGGVEDGETTVEAAKREIKEETGYKNFKFIKQLGGPVQTEFFAAHKDVNRIAHTTQLLFELVDDEHDELDAEEAEIHELVWIPEKDIKPDTLRHIETGLILERMHNGEKPFPGQGVLIHSDKFNGLESEKAKKEITKFLGAKLVTQYKMRDAIFARQRYWGEPIPLMHDKNGVIHELPEKKLPLKLPDVKSYQPTGTGESPLASVPAWVKAGYETNTMPGWAGSSWYFLRYMDPRNKKAFADKSMIKYWKNVDMYVGGAEHATGHILYARFWHKFLFDMGLVTTDEPFLTWKTQGMILGADGQKMSKRWGNVVNPDEIVKTYGADTLRVYEMFMGPFEGSLPWSTENIIGSRRFIERVWKLSTKVTPKVARTVLDTEKVSRMPLDMVLHKTIKKVTEDISGFAFNTAISAMMILTNEMEKQDTIAQKDFELFLKILSPFAPHVTEEIWHTLGHKTMLVTESWPKADEKKMKETEMKIVIQVNSRTRAELVVPVGTTENDIVERAQKLEAVDKWVGNNPVRKAIYVPGRLVNFVV